MSTWRRKAIEAVADFRDVIERAHSVMALWIELRSHFERAVKVGDMDAARRILGYARYSLAAPSADVRTAVMVAFVEHLPEEPAIREALPALMSAEEIRGLRRAMAYHAGERAVSELEEACRERAKTS